MSRTQELTAAGQSIWLDYIRRDLIQSGELAAMIEEMQVRGVTSNPSIFQKAISGSDLYTETLRRLAWAGYGPERAFDVLAVEDIRAAADVFRPLYEQTDGGDGYVSLEVNPRLARDTQRTLQEARRLWEVVNRPNLMVKIPATVEGLPAIEEAIFEGININVTLIFSLERYAEVMEAYLLGLERRVEKGLSIQHIASVASFFVSRIDSAVDAELQHVIDTGGDPERVKSLFGTAAVASARLAYAQFRAVFGSERFQHLAEKGAKLQRPLWASTSTKNPDYPDTMYVDSLIGPDTVNTLPPETLEAFSDHGHVALTLESGISGMRMQHEALANLGISLDKITGDLEREGVEKFTQAFDGLTGALEKEITRLRGEVGPVAEALEQAVDELRREQVGRRIWGRDVSLWTRDESAVKEVKRRLGWLTLPQETPSELESYRVLRNELREEGIDQVLWLGMGGSSLAADVLSRLFPDSGGLKLRVLDSTDPVEVAEASAWAVPARTLFVAASKSGTTAEPLAMLDLFWESAGELLGEGCGRHFVVVTDPGTALEQRAKDQSFRNVFSSPADVGGRYSALSVFGMLPAVLLGVDAALILEGARAMAGQCNPNREPAINPGLSLAALMAAGVRQGRPILVLPADPELQNFADWIEQLIAESSGKDGTGIFPLVGQEPDPGAYGSRHLVVYLRASGKHDGLAPELLKAGVPFCALQLSPDPAAIGAAFFQWEYATAAVCALIDVNAFDQPNVQQAKIKTVELMNRYEKSGVLPAPDAVFEDDDIVLAGTLAGSPAGEQARMPELLEQILKEAQDSYLALLLFIPRTEGNIQAAGSLSRKLQHRGVPASVGFGPRYLHSTGQLHKGGIPGAYLVVTQYHEQDVPIPGRPYGFRVFERAQALGDLQSLIEIDRPVLWLDLKHEGAFTGLEAAFGLQQDSL